MANTPFSAKITLTVDRSKETQFREEIQSYVDRASSGVKLNLPSSSSSPSSSNTPKIQQELKLRQQIASLTSRVTTYVQNNSKAYEKYGHQLDAILQTLNQDIKNLSIKDLNDLKVQFAEIQANAKRAGATGHTFFEIMRRGWEKFGGWSLVTKSLTKTIQTIKTMIENVKALDTALTELKKVTNETDAAYNRFLDKAISKSKDVGASLSDTVNASADFARLGYDIDQSLDLAEAALIYKNVGDGIDDITQASESLISTIKAFGIEAENAMVIVDKFNIVGNNFAISSSGLGTALQKSASSMAAANNSLEETIALATAMNAVLQNPEIVGTALKTVSMYLRAAKTEAEEAGESVDGMANSASELRKELLQLTGQRVDIMLDENTFKSTYQIMKELSQVWDSLADVDRSNILELIGGKRNATAVTSLLTNFKDAEEALATATNSAGSALEENEKYLDSIAGKASQIKAIAEDLSQNLIDIEFIKDVADAIIGLANTINSFVEAIGSLPSLAAAASAAFSLLGKNTKYITYSDKHFKLFNRSLQDVVSNYHYLNETLGHTKASSFMNMFDTKEMLPQLHTAERIIKDYNLLVSQKVTVPGSELLNTWNDKTNPIGVWLKQLDNAPASLNDFAKFTQSLNVTQKELARGFGSSISLIDDYNKLITYTGVVPTANLTKEINNLNSVTGAYFRSLKGKEASIKGLTSYVEQLSGSINGVSAATKAWQLACGALNLVLNAAKYAIISLVITKLISYVDNVVHATDRLIESTREAEESISNLKKEFLENKSAIQSLSSEFSKLSKGVDEYGNNVTLSSEEFERYKSIIQQLVQISPELSNGYSEENGYIVQKNDLLEKAIQLEEQSYKQELRRLTSTEAMTQAMAGYIAEYEKLYNSEYANSSGAFQDTFYNLFKNTPNDGVNGRKNAAHFIVDQLDLGYGQYIREAIDSEYNIFNDYAEGIANNIDYLIASLNYSELGFKTKEEFDVATTILRDSAKDYLDELQNLNAINDRVVDFLDNVAASNDKYDKLNDGTKNIISSYLERFDISDVSDNQIDNAKLKTEINDFINSITPQIDQALSHATDIRSNFENNHQFAEFYKKEISEIIDSLKDLGADESIISLVQESLGLDVIEQQIDHVRDLLVDEYDFLADDFTKKELELLFGLDTTDAGYAIDELKDKLEELKIQASDFVNALDMSGMFDNLESVVDGYDDIIDAMADLNAGTALTKQGLMELVEQYPKLLEQSNLFTDGSIQGQKNLLNTILESKEIEYDSHIETKIKELEASILAYEKQIEVEEEKLKLIVQMGVDAANGRIQTEQDLTDIQTEFLNLQGTNYVDYENGKITANREFINQVINSQNNAGEVTSNIWEQSAFNINSAMEQAGTGVVTSTAKTVQKSVSLWTKLSTAAKMVGENIKSFFSGNGFVHDLGSILGSFDDKNYTTIESGVTIDTKWDSKHATIDGSSINDWISLQSKNITDRVSALNKQIDTTKIVIENLKSLKGLDLTTIYGKGGSGSGSSNSIDEYIADIDKYYEALLRLERAQKKREQLEKRIEYTTDPAEKIKLTNDLIDAYKDEASIEQELIDQRAADVEKNVAALRELGFEVDYNNSTHQLFIRNMEHLNELTADSKGKYDSLQEATNELRKSTEDLIDATEELNDDNKESAENIEETAYSILDAKNDIVSYIEEIYDAQVDAYKEIIDLKKEAIELSKEESDYEKDKADAVKEIAELEAEIAQLSLDNSREAAALMAEKEAELAEKNKELADKQADHTYDTQMDVLDQSAEDYEKQREKDLEILKATVYESEEAWNPFYQTLMGNNIAVGDSINKEVANAWLNAAEAVKIYSGTVAGVATQEVNVDNIPKYHTGGVVGSTSSKEEVLAMLQKGEVVLNEPMQDSLYKMIDFHQYMSEKLGKTIGDFSLLTGAGIVSPTFAPFSTEPMLANESPVYNIDLHTEVSVYHSGDMSTTDLNKYGDQIANTTMNKLLDAFEQRGINSAMRARIKP